MLKKVAGFFAPQLKEPSVCEECGSEFICGVSVRGCWCMSYEVSEENRKRLKEAYSRCLCEPCLKKYADGVEESLETV